MFCRSRYRSGRGRFRGQPPDRSHFNLKYDLTKQYNKAWQKSAQRPMRPTRPKRRVALFTHPATRRARGFCGGGGGGGGGGVLRAVAPGGPPEAVLAFTWPRTCRPYRFCGGWQWCLLGARWCGLRSHTRPPHRAAMEETQGRGPRHTHFRFVWMCVVCVWCV